jgi:hypothetical protein
MTHTSIFNSIHTWHFSSMGRARLLSCDLVYAHIKPTYWLYVLKDLVHESTNKFYIKRWGGNEFTGQNTNYIIILSTSGCEMKEIRDRVRTMQKGLNLVLLECNLFSPTPTQGGRRMGAFRITRQQMNHVQQ